MEVLGEEPTALPQSPSAVFIVEYHETCLALPKIAAANAITLTRRLSLDGSMAECLSPGPVLVGHSKPSTRRMKIAGERPLG